MSVYSGKSYEYLQFPLTNRNEINEKEANKKQLVSALRTDFKKQLLRFKYYFACCSRTCKILHAIYIAPIYHNTQPANKKISHLLDIHSEMYSNSPLK